jgi:hypothetical protein
VTFCIQAKTTKGNVIAQEMRTVEICGLETIQIQGSKLPESELVKEPQSGLKMIKNFKSLFVSSSSLCKININYFLVKEV